MYAALCVGSVYLVTCSEDGSIRVWGQPPQDSNDAEGQELLAMSPMERFTGKR